MDSIFKSVTRQHEADLYALASLAQEHDNLMSAFNESTDPQILDELCYLMKANELGQRYYRGVLR